MRQYFTPKLLFAGLFMLAFTGMTSCNKENNGDGQNNHAQPTQIETVTESNNGEKQNDSSDANELIEVKTRLSELNETVSTLKKTSFYATMI